MKRWRLQTDQDHRRRSGCDRVRRLEVELLELRTLLSIVHAAVLPTPKPAHVATAPPKNPFPPYHIVARIDPSSDPDGSGNVFEQTIKVSGVARPNSTVWLAVGTRPGYFTNVTRAGGAGNFTFQLPIGDGSSVLQVFAEDVNQNYSDVATVKVARGNPIVAWDSLALGAFQNQNTSPAEAARDLAVLHAAQYDAVAAVTSPDSAYQVHVTAPQGASAEAAADSSAYTVLTGLFPLLKSTFSTAYSDSVAGLPNNPSTTSGLALGVQVGNQTLANRANDGSNTVADFPPLFVNGLWRPTPPSFAPAVDAQFGQVTPFEIPSGSAYRPAAPPAVGSATYDQALMQVASLGALDSTTRTTGQTKAAEFWSDPVGSLNSPGPWNRIAEQISIGRKDSLVQDARIFAQLDFALADAAIASADSQYTYDEWRPISAIQQTNPAFTSLVTTPASPSYVSDRAAFGAAASAVLSSAFGSKSGFTVTVNPATGLTRTFSSFAAAATEDASSQVWGGISFAFDAQAGVDLGAKVAQTVLANLPKAK
jgi:PAP2 superfamily